MIKLTVKKVALAAAAVVALAVPVAASAQRVVVEVGGGRAYDPYYGGYVVYDAYGRWADPYGNWHYRDGRWFDRWGHWHGGDDWGWRGPARGYDRGYGYGRTYSYDRGSYGHDRGGYDHGRRW